MVKQQQSNAKRKYAETETKQQQHPQRKTVTSKQKPVTGRLKIPKAIVGTKSIFHNSSVRGGANIHLVYRYDFEINDGIE